MAAKKTLKARGLRFSSTAAATAGAITTAQTEKTEPNRNASATSGSRVEASASSLPCLEQRVREQRKPARVVRQQPARGPRFHCPDIPEHRRDQAGLYGRSEE